MKKRDNRGVTLVELIIVMAILGVIIGMTGFGLGMITKKPCLLYTSDAADD